MGEEMKDAPEIDITSSPINFNKFWRQGRKKISSSMSHIHNGHYIAATFSYFLSTITAHLSSLPWELGCTIKQWQKSLNVAIEKHLAYKYWRN